MNKINSALLQKANIEAIYNLYLYLAYKKTPKKNETLFEIANDLSHNMRNNIGGKWSNKEVYRLGIFKNAVTENDVLKNTKIGDFIFSPGGLSACTFIKPNNEISVTFKGTGSGEWIDNGEGLSGISEENTYISYDKDGQISYEMINTKDYATDQQVEALNWFSYIASKNRWDKTFRITLSGHSKGGNKAQFIAINSELFDACFSFGGQGFSPEAIGTLKHKHQENFYERRKRIYSFSAENDYVNVLGKRLMPKENVFFFKSFSCIHFIECILDYHGHLRPQASPGILSKYMESVSASIMRLPPKKRQYATLGIMNICQKYIGQGLPLNGDSVSFDKTVKGLILAISHLLHNII